MQQLTAVAGEFDGWLPPREVLTAVRAFPTIFPQLDVATRIGGWPLQRVCLLHGPSNHGKSACLHGLGLSALRAGGIYLLIDAEYTTDEVWLEKLMGPEIAHPGFRALHPRNYEETVERTRVALAAIIARKRTGQLDQDVPVMVGLDSLTKLVPTNLLAKLQKEEGGIDGAKGRGAMIKAVFNAAWLDELVPQLYEAGANFTIVTRESENVDAKGPWDPKWKIKGGKAAQYESSVTARITRSGWIKRGEKIVGERHQVEVRKTKVGGKDDKTIVAHFHSSNGVDAPEGYWRERDVVEMATTSGLYDAGRNASEVVDDDGEVHDLHELVAALRADVPRMVALELRARQEAAVKVDGGARAVSEPDEGAEAVFADA